MSTLAAPPGWTVSPSAAAAGGATQRPAPAPASTQPAAAAPAAPAARPPPSASGRSRRHRPSRQVQPEPAWAATYSNPMADTELPSQFHRRGPGAQQAAVPLPSRRSSSRPARQADPRQAEVAARAQASQGSDSALLSPEVAGYARQQSRGKRQAAKPVPPAPAGADDLAGQHQVTPQGYITGVQVPQLPDPAPAQADSSAAVGSYRVSSQGYIMGPTAQPERPARSEHSQRSSKPQPHSSWAFVPSRSPPETEPQAASRETKRQAAAAAEPAVAVPPPDAQPSSSDAQPPTPDTRRSMLPEEAPAGAQGAYPAALGWSDARSAESAVAPRGPGGRDRAPAASPLEASDQGTYQRSWQDARELDSAAEQEASSHSSHPAQLVRTSAVQQAFSCGWAGGCMCGGVSARALNPHRSSPECCSSGPR